MKKQYWNIGVLLLLTSVLVYLLYWRFQVSQTRFFDVDEFSYMHWTAQIARGEHMYTDFFSYITPGFMWVFAPIYWICGVSVQVFTAARTVSFIIFLGILGSLGYLFGITRGWKWALLPVVMLAFLPMPYDKFLEIRPDNLATLLAIVGVIGEIWAIRKKNNNWPWLVSGLAYGASLFVLVKTLPFVAVGAGVAILSSRKKFPLFMLGIIVPWALFILGETVAGRLSIMWYSLTRLPFEAYKTAVNYYMGPNLLFYPNDWFYGRGSSPITFGLIVNHVIWILALVVGAYRLVTPVRGKKDDTLIELLIAGIFFVSVASYIKFFPLKHSQYLISIAVFVAYYAADGLANFFDWLTSAGGRESLSIVLLGFAYLLVVVTRDVNTPKLLWTNTAQLTEVATLIQTVPLTDRVVDLEGRMVFWPDGYPVSGLPFDAFLSYVSRRPPPLAQYLAIHPAEYIYEGDSNRFITFSAENLAYIKAHFAPVAGFGGRLLKSL